VKVTDDDWVRLDVDGEVLLFKPFQSHDVDAAAAEVATLLPGARPRSSHPLPSVHIAEIADGHPPPAAEGSSGSFTSSSEGFHADQVIALTSLPTVVQAGSREDEHLADLMAMTTKMLKRPGMQVEVVKAMMEDEEIREIMLRQCSDLDAYLLAAGVPAPHLLLPPAAAASLNQAAGSTQGEEGGPTVVDKLVEAVARALEGTGSALAALGGWLRDRLGFLLPFRGRPQEQSKGQEQGQGQEHRAGRGRADAVLGGVMVLAVTVFCLLVIRRPLHSFLRRRA